MSHLNTKHGSCSALFSNSPINFNKENKAPTKVLHGCTSYPDLARKEQKMEQISSLTRKKSSSVETVTPKRYESASQFRNTNSPALANATRCKSAITLPKHDSQHPKKSMSDEKMKTPSKTGKSLTSQTPIMCFSTSKGSTTKVDGASFRTPVKRLMRDHPISHSTPDCFGAVQFETPRSTVDIALDEVSLDEEETSNLTVGVRIRPLNFKELNDPKLLSVVKVKGSNIVVDYDSTQHSYAYDHCFVSYTDTTRSNHASQETVFNTLVLPLVQNAFEGYNVCLFAYGQTGSGKSYSMMGSESTASPPCENTGIIPRFCDDLFIRAAKNRHITTTIEISYFEIYNEKIHDLLANTTATNASKRAPLKVREHPSYGPYVVDLSQHIVQNYEDLQSWLKVGNSQRATAATGMNEKSSRSHSIFSIILTQGQKTDSSTGTKSGEGSRRSKINLVDLAGSERVSQTCASGDRLREGVSINKSLLSLGKVIASLAENTSNRKRGFVPYRESVLTWLLKESLGGNSKTAMLATVSPSNVHVEETLATLRYACQARSIINRVRINEDPHDKLIRELKAEVLRLRGMREGCERQLVPRKIVDNGGCNNEIQKKQREIDKLKDQLKKTEERLALTQKSWSQRLQTADECKKSEINFLRRCGIAIDFREKHSTPCLVNLADDPMLSGTLLYLIPVGKVRIGRREKQAKLLDILLEGPLVAPLHCTIENDNGILSLVPEANGDTYVNGQMVCDRVFLKHGDRLIIGGNHYFKVCNPNDERSKNHSLTQPIDYEFAHQEILASQEEKLRAELEESKQKAMKDLENAKREVEIQLGTQKSTYEREIKLLGSTLEQHKVALDKINKQKRELEVEKELLTYQIEENKRRELTSNDQIINLSPYQSNFLQELQKVLNDTTTEVETAMSIAMSNDAITTGGITLHEMQLHVREATERCRDIGLNYEFLQQRVIEDKGLQPVIRVRDRDRKLESLWRPMNFLNWVHRLRDFDGEDTLKELLNFDDNWEVYDDESECPEDTLDASRISINLTPVKKQLNESLHQLSLNSSFLDMTADDTNDSVRQRRQQDMEACLIQMELAATTLSKLCHQHETRETSGEVTKSLDTVKNIISSLRECLHTVHNSSDSNSNINNTVIKLEEPLEQPKIVTKSSLNKVCPFLNENPSKTVRFNIQ